MDNIVLLYLREVAAHRKYPPAAFLSCRGILSLEKKFGQERLVAACMCASQLRAYGYQEVLGILHRGDDAAFLSTQEDPADNPVLPSHKNIRGREYFSRASNQITVKNHKE